MIIHYTRSVLITLWIMKHVLLQEDKSNEKHLVRMQVIGNINNRSIIERLLSFNNGIQAFVFQPLFKC